MRIRTISFKRSRPARPVISQANPRHIDQAPCAAVKNGGSPMTANIARKVVKAFHRVMAPATTTAELSARESEVLRLLAQVVSTRKSPTRWASACRRWFTCIRRIYEASCPLARPGDCRGCPAFIPMAGERESNPRRVRIQPGDARSNHHPDPLGPALVPSRCHGGHGTRRATFPQWALASRSGRFRNWPVGPEDIAKALRVFDPHRILRLGRDSRRATDCVSQIARARNVRRPGQRTSGRLV